MLSSLKKIISLWCIMTLLITGVFAVSLPGRANAAGAAAPDWVKDLITYELNPRGFTSPNGSGDGNGSGTFNSLKDKMPYLQELGINGIWLAGFSKSTDHFYNLWSVYACYRPDELDPVLGTSTDFQNMIDEAHSRGIRVFLDVISHGVLNESTLITEHPTWFSGGSWNMTDYNYNNSEFCDWWVDTWTNYVDDYGIDGFRIDLTMVKADVWDRITTNCANIGKPIVVFPELERYHFKQHDYDSFSTNVASSYGGCAEKYYGLEISCHDEGYMSAAGNYYRVKGSRVYFGYSGIFTPNVPVFFSGEEWNADQVSLPNLEKDLYGGGGPGGWLYGSWLQWDQLNESDHAAMLDDAKKIISIKKNNSDVLSSDRFSSNICEIPCSPSPSYKPYARYLGREKAIVVVANSSTTSNATYTLNIPLETMMLDCAGRYKVTDLWADTVTYVTEEQLASYQVTVTRDKVPGGGLKVLKIEPETSMGTIVDDRNPGITYSTGWTQYNDQAGHYKNTITATNESGKYFEYTFNGNYVTWYTQLNSDSGQVDIYIDGVLDKTLNLREGSGRKYHVPIYTRSGLAAGNHTIKVTTKDTSWVINDGIAYGSSSGGGSLEGSSEASSGNTSLSSEGTVDWAHYGYGGASGYNHKSGVTSQISNKFKVGYNSASQGSYSPTFSWTGGTPTATVSNTNTGVYVGGLGCGFKLFVPASTTERTLKLYVSAYKSIGKFEFSLSDGSAAPYVDYIVSTSGTTDRVYTITFRASGSNQMLIVKTMEVTSNDWFASTSIRAAILY